MNGVLKILTKIGEYIYRNSVWLIPVLETAYRTIKKYFIRRKKDDRRVETENQNGSGKD